jgi:hypothetical protein
VQGNTLRRSVDDIEAFSLTVSDQRTRPFLQVSLLYTSSIVVLIVIN